MIGSNNGIWNILLTDRIVDSNSFQRSKKKQYSNEIKHFINWPRKLFIPESMELRLNVIFVIIIADRHSTINIKCHTVPQKYRAPRGVHQKNS